jgi:NADPH:quinone reductase-like Zn-dependent oxidoreductase
MLVRRIREGKIMKAFVIDHYGGAESLNWLEIPTPVPAAGQIVVRIHATTFNPIDKLLASGVARDEMPVTFPWIPGADFSGTVDRIGEGVLDLKTGDAVFGYSPTGGAYAQQIVLDAGLVGLKSRSLSDIEAASLALVGQTAWQALDAANLKAGQTILIHGAAGSVGSAAVQLAHSRGAHVIATCSAESADFIKSLGADQVIDYTATPFESIVKDVDAVLDTVGGETQRRSFTVIKPGGYLVALNQAPSPDLAAKFNVHIVMLNTQPSRAGLVMLTKQVDLGEIKPNIGKVFSLEEAPRVWSELAALKITGKIVFNVP